MTYTLILGMGFGVDEFEDTWFQEFLVFESKIEPSNHDCKIRPRIL